jgi:hypothetical protein
LGGKRANPTADSHATFIGYNSDMVVQGHIQNGVIVTGENLALPDGTEVTILVRSNLPATNDSMSPERRIKYLEALKRIDAISNENPGDSFSNTDHDQALYGKG